MQNFRFRSVELAHNRPLSTSEPVAQKVSDYFAENVFTMSKMQKYLSVEVFKTLKKSIEHQKPIGLDIADPVASAMKVWATSKGTTHYTHWFQPLTGTTAEKHDAFFSLKDKESGIEEFKGTNLIQQEPDASSFPSGGLRNTFEARGYTAWDTSSPAFLMDTDAGKILCIPTVFVSYTGEALDNKAPLLRSLKALDKAATEVCAYFDTTVKSVSASLGCEQEFFLVDRSLFYARPDLVMCDRTVFGKMVPKGQQLDDHYFGAIPSRVQNFLHQLEIEAYKLGIPITTRHNEVAPSQFEVAPIFEEVNMAVDHNQLLMNVMKKLAKKHHFKVIFHEKPFANLNGSGKHNNWS